MKFFARNKKGDLSISVNAIVILIVAIVALGLILIFTRSIFTQASGKVKQAIGLGELDNPPSIDNPITITPSEIELRVGDKATTLALNFMNPGATAYCKLTGTQFPASSAIAPFTPSVSVTYDNSCFQYSKNQVNQYKAPLSIPTAHINYVGGNIIVTMTMQCYSTLASCRSPGATTTYTDYSKQLVLTVTP